MIYGTLLFIVIVLIIFLAWFFVKKAASFKNVVLKNRWFWGIFSIISLVSGIVIIPEKLPIVKIPLIIFGIWASMVFFEMTRLLVEQGMFLNNLDSTKLKSGK